MLEVGDTIEHSCIVDGEVRQAGDAVVEVQHGAQRNVGNGDVEVGEVGAKDRSLADFPFNLSVFDPNWTLPLVLGESVSLCISRTYTAPSVSFLATQFSRSAIALQFRAICVLPH